MSLLSSLKPDPDKWTLSVLLFIMYWTIYVISNWSADYLHAQIYPLLNQPLPYQVSFSIAWTAMFEEYLLEVERSKMPFIVLKLFISYIGCYMTACLLIFLIRKVPSDT